MGWIPQPGDSVVDSSGITYVLNRLIGEGGQGVVYTTEAEGVAVKISTAASIDAQRIEERISSVMRLPVGDLPVALPRSILPSAVGYAMTMLTGMNSVGDLTRPIGASFDQDWYVATGGLRKRLAVIEALGDVINRLHTRGLVYGDLSANNVLVSASPDKWRLFLIDLDNVQPADQKPRRIFTAPYAAPEQNEGATVASDRFSMAAVAFAVLTGSNPFYGEMLDLLSPEDLASKPFALRAPFIDHPNDGSNRFAHVIDRSLVISPSMNRLLETTFVAGRFEPSRRIDANTIAMAALRARHALIQCSDCGWDNFLPLHAVCGSCGHPLPSRVIRIGVLEGDAWRPYAPCPMTVADCDEVHLSARALGLGGSADVEGLRISINGGGLAPSCRHPGLRHENRTTRSRRQLSDITIERQAMAPLRLSLSETGSTP